MGPLNFFTLSLFTFYCLGYLCPRLAGTVTLLAQNGTADLRLKRHLIVFPAIIANDLKTFWCVRSRCCSLRAAFCAPLRRHHVALVKHFLVLFSEHKNVSTLNTRNLYVGHFHSSNYGYKTSLSHSTQHQPDISRRQAQQHGSEQSRRGFQDCNPPRDTKLYAPRMSRPPMS